MPTKAYLKAKIVFKGRITCLTGLHIGGVEAGVDVGGIDKFVIRNPRNDEPYIPGSSLKGKIRSLVEYAYVDIEELRKVSGGIAVMPNDPAVKALFGQAIERSSDNANNNRNQTQESQSTGQASKVLFRDAVLSRADREESAAQRFTNGLKYTERKAENTLKRITAAATPRQIERIPAGTRFTFSIVVNVDEDNKKSIIEQLRMLETGFRLLEMDGLGGMVSRGYGRVRVRWGKIEILNVVDPETNDNKALDDLKFEGKTFEEVIGKIGELAGTW